MRKLARKSRGYVIVAILIGLLGLTLSLVLHELFHVFMHWGSVSHINFFPHMGALVQVDVMLPPGYDLEGEEIAAYCITLLVILITVAIIFKIGDSEDKRSSGQILFPNDKKMQKMNPSKMLELSELDDMSSAPSPKQDKKKQ